MRTTLDLDERALAQALAASGGGTKTAVVNEALREYARRRKLRGFLSLRGKVKWEGDLDQLRKRSARA
jgi:Arc/MetJ family transcription regulator